MAAARLYPSKLDPWCVPQSSPALHFPSENNHFLNHIFKNWALTFRWCGVKINIWSPGLNYNPSVCHVTCLFGGLGSGSVSCLNKCQFCLVTVYQRLNLVSGPVSHFQHLSVYSNAIPYHNITFDLLNRTYLFNLHIWKHETEGLLRNNRIWRFAKSFRQQTIKAKCVCNIGSQDTVQWRHQGREPPRLRPGKLSTSE